jgi:hypothetical protein
VLLLRPSSAAGSFTNDPCVRNHVATAGGH